MSSVAQPPSSAACPNRPKSWVLRAQEIPLEWSEKFLTDQLQHSFSGHAFRVDSLCKHPINPSSTALIGFYDHVPEVLSDLDTGKESAVELDIGGSEIIFDHCLGLTTLFEPAGGEAPMADIIFVHGLGGHAIGSWTAPNGKCWPRDFLRNALAGIRVLSFGYEAKLKQDTSTSQLSDFGQQLLGDLDTFRTTPEDQRRPLFLVGHSFGGTIINWTLHEMSSKREYQETLKAIRCATFFGTPHQGMSTEFLEPLTEKRVHSSMKRTLADLQANSELLRMLFEALQRLSTDIRFITCIEQKLTPIPGSTNGSTDERKYEAVSRGAARLYTQSESIIAIHADHREMVKFSSRSDRHYMQVLRKLQTALDDCRPDRPKIRTLTGDQRLRLLNSLASPKSEERQASIKDPYETTCEWFLESPEYVRWLSSSKEMMEEDPFLWVTGRAGSGKSTAMKFAFTRHRTRQSSGPVIGFFFDDRGTDFQKSARGMYQSLLRQVLEQTDRVPCEVHALDQWMQSEHSKWETSALKELLEYIIPSLGRPLLCFIDALDECQSSDTRDLLAFLKRLAQLCAERQTIFRVCLSIRQISEQKREFCLERQEGHSWAILKYIEHKLQIGPGMPFQDIQQSLQQKASGIFLWAVLAVEILQKESTFSSLPSFRERLSRMPTDLTELYRHFLVEGNQGRSREKLFLCLECVLAAKEPPHPSMVYYFILSNTDPATRGATTDGTPTFPAEDSAANFVLEASQGLLEITRTHSPVVRFIHKSVPNFLVTDETINTPQQGFRGRSHDRSAHFCGNLMKKFPLTAPRTLDENEYPDYGHWQDYQRSAEMWPESSIEHDDYRWRETQEGAYELEYPRDSGYALDYYIGDYDDSGYPVKPSHAETDWLPPSPDPLTLASKYAAENILYHANEAARDGIAQTELLQDFPLEEWIQVTNALSDRPTCTPKASLLYVLAEQDMAELIASHPARLSYLDPEEQAPCGTPFFAALANGNLDTVRAFFNMELNDPSRRPAAATTTTTNFLDQRSAPEKYAELCESYLGSIAELQTAFMRQIWTGSGDAATTRAPLVDYEAVKSFMTQPGNEFLHMYLLLTGRAALDGGDRDKEKKKKTTTTTTTQSLFKWSAEHGRVRLLQSFFDDGGLDPDGEAGATALMLAAEEGHEHVVGMLLGQGLRDLDRKDDERGGGRTPLAAALARGHVEVARMLLATGKVDVEAKDGDGRTPLALAASSGSVEAVKLLLRHGGVRVNGKDRAGRTPLSLAVDGGSQAVLAHLVRVGADPNLGDAGRRTPLSWAAEKGAFDISQYLIKECRADKCSKDVHGLDPLDYAMWGRRRLKADEHKKAGDYDAVIRLLDEESLLLQESRAESISQYEQQSQHDRGLQHGQVSQHQGGTHHEHALQYAEHLQHAEWHHHESHSEMNLHYGAEPQYEVESPYNESHYEHEDGHHHDHFNGGIDYNHQHDQDHYDHDAVGADDDGFEGHVVGHLVGHVMGHEDEGAYEADNYEDDEHGHELYQEEEYEDEEHGHGMFEEEDHADHDYDYGGYDNE